MAEPQSNTAFPSREELLVLADYFEERGDPRAEVARAIPIPPDRAVLIEWVPQFLPLLTPAVQHEAACVFAERALRREQELGYEPDSRLWAAINAKRAWLRREIDERQLESAKEAADAVVRTARRPSMQEAAHAVSQATERVASWAARWAWLRSIEQLRICINRDAFGGPDQQAPDIYRRELLWHVRWIMEKAWGSDGAE